MIFHITGKLKHSGYNRCGFVAFFTLIFVLLLLPVSYIPMLWIL